MPAELPWILLAALVVVVLALSVVLRRQRSRSVAELEQARSAHDARITETEAAHQVAKRAAEQERDAARQLAERAREVLTKGLKHELASHQEIVAACSDAGLDGVLATNVVFLPADSRVGRSFVAQVDHVLLTNAAVTILESKRWQGVVFDGRRPSETHPAFRGLFDEADLGDDFALQLVRNESEGGGLKVRRHLAEKSPRAQVRRQAQRLHEHLRSATGSAPWIEHAVYYSHPSAVVHTAPGASSTKASRTTIIAGAEGLRTWMRGPGASSRSIITNGTIEQYAQHFSALGARVERFGAFAG